MNFLQSTFIILVFVACSNTQKNKSIHTTAQVETKQAYDTIVQTKKENFWQDGFGLSHNPDKDTIWNKSVSYYLSNDDCSGLAKDFYYGQLKPSDNGMTKELLKLVTTDNEELRPFYRWCLDKTILIQDGALGEYTGNPARKYIEKFPKEFFDYMDTDTTHSRYADWIAAIEYSGFYKEENYNGKEAEVNMKNAMNQNCKNCNKEIVRRIEVFANECFN